jgi:hypothetical protein
MHEFSLTSPYSLPSRSGSGEGVFSTTGEIMNLTQKWYWFLRQRPGVVQVWTTVRHFTQPRVLRLAVIAALATAAACYPRLALWPKRPSPMWFVEAVIFLGTTVLWGFVFAWHTHYTHRPVFTFKVELKPLAAATLAGLCGAITLHFFLDPSLRLTTPEDYPANLEQWLATTLFSLSFSQLFLVFAPFAWLIRLFQNRWIATVLTILLGVFVLVLKTRSSPAPIPPSLFSALLIVRLVSGVLSVLFYLRGGLLLVWWLGFLIEARHLLNLMMG